jgi:hypothetical protein
MKYYVAIGSVENNSGLECEVECELQIGDFVEMWHCENKGDDRGEVVIIKNRLYSTYENALFFYAERIK